MNPEKDYSENLSQTLNVLADKLGVKAEQLFETVMKQTRIELYMNIIYLLVFIAMFISGIYGAAYVFPYYMADLAFPEGKQVIIFIISVGSFFFLLIPLLGFFSTIHETITLKFNPKYWALHDILSSLNN